MRVQDYFQADNAAHLEALDFRVHNGEWPTGFLPEGVVCGEGALEDLVWRGFMGAMALRRTALLEAEEAHVQAAEVAGALGRARHLVEEVCGCLMEVGPYSVGLGSEARRHGARVVGKDFEDRPTAEKHCGRLNMLIGVMGALLKEPVMAHAKVLPGWAKALVERVRRLREGSPESRSALLGVSGAFARLMTSAIALESNAPAASLEQVRRDAVDLAAEALLVADGGRGEASPREGGL